MPAKKQKDNDFKFSLRIPSDLHEWLQEQADEERRSLNSYILYQLQIIKKQIESSQAVRTAGAEAVRRDG